jgi:hypothetical protein
VLYNDNVLLETKIISLRYGYVYGDLWIVGEQGKGLKSLSDFIDFHFLKQTSLGHPSTFMKRIILYLWIVQNDLKIVSDWTFKVFCRHKVSVRSIIL